MNLKAKEVIYTLEDGTKITVPHKEFERWRADTPNIFHSARTENGFAQVDIWCFIDASSPLFSLYGHKYTKAGTLFVREYFTTQRDAIAFANKFLQDNKEDK